MNEGGWLAATDPRQLLKGLTGRGKARRLRLCAVACCRLVARLLPDDRCRRAIEVAEAYADKWATGQQLARAGEEISQSQADELSHHAGTELTCRRAARVFATEAVCYTVSRASRTFAETAASRVASALGFSQLPPDAPIDSVGHAEVNRIHEAGCRAQLPTVHDVLRNPFRPFH